MPTEVIEVSCIDKKVNHLALTPFRMDIPARQTPPPFGELTHYHLWWDRELLSKPDPHFSFLIGPFSRLIDPETSMMKAYDIEPILTIRRTYRQIGVTCYNSHTRELYGLYSMSSESATQYDRRGVLRSRMVTVLPQALSSKNTMEEIRYSLTLGKSMIFTFRKEDPEWDFQEEMKDWIAKSPAVRDPIYFVTFDNQEDLSKQLVDIWVPILGRNGNKEIPLKV